VKAVKVVKPANVALESGPDGPYEVFLHVWREDGKPLTRQQIVEAVAEVCLKLWKEPEDARYVLEFDA
jgi:hypothetical protein